MLPEPMRRTVYLFQCEHRALLHDDEAEAFRCGACGKWLENPRKVGTIAVRLDPQTGNLVTDADGGWWGDDD